MFLVVFLGFRVPAQSDPDEYIRKLCYEFSHAESDTIRIDQLFRLAYLYNDRLDKPRKADSISEIAVRIAEQSRNPNLILLAYNAYIESNDVQMFFDKALKYANEAIRISTAGKDPVFQARSWHNLAAVYFSANNGRKVLDASKKELVLAGLMKSPSWRALAYLDLGNSLACENQILKAFEKYLTATEIAETTKDTALLLTCYSKLSDFFNTTKLFDKAREYKTRQATLIRAHHPVDSVALMWTNFDLRRIDSREGSRSGNTTSLREVIDFGIRHRIDRLTNWGLALYRQYLVGSEKLDSLYIYYHQIYPGELSKLRVSDSAMFYRLMALFAELKNKVDSAEYYFNKAASLVKNDPNLIMQSNFHRRFGQFLIRHGRTEEAIRQFRMAYELADRDTYPFKFEFMLNASKELKDLYALKKDFHHAFLYSDLTNQLNDSLANMVYSSTRKEEFLMLDINRVIQKRERANELEKQRSERIIRQQKAQRNMMAAVVIFLVILSYLIFRNYRNQKRSNQLLDAAKKKSDHLLLNILPYETAEELKLTGTAKAKRYDEVTVMFTDFKNFTQASEKMSPEELVGVINSYFSEFDKIVSRLGIEKIKIIGDSYMCAGGLPIPNTTHAHDVVNAALELQSFMESERVERSQRGEFFFELRIGIHTGPVIAGIVGLRKFAYDIWGDTVNTASRMENAGEVNRVNISGNTYERVRDQFKCTYRGKVNAKHKGEVDMYFVESFSAGGEFDS
jgi:class 3 adenylate cyclase